MEVSARISKEAPGVCRCCLTEGCYKEMSSEHSWMGELEVYTDMMIDCFDISISLQSNGPNGLKRLICEVCITRLRDACNFKKQVQDAENKFIEKVQNGLFIQLETKVIKNEESDFMELEAEYLEEDFVTEHSGDEAIPSELKVEEEDVPLSSLTKSKSKPVKRKAEAVKKPKTKKAAASKKTEKDNESGSEANDIEPDNHENKIEKKNSEVPPALIVFERNSRIFYTVITILKHSTVTPFRFLKHNYKCFFCYKVFRKSDEFNEHYKTCEKKDDIDICVRSMVESELFVEVSNISCKLCDQWQLNLEQLAQHLTSVHEIIVGDICCLVPFEFNEYMPKCLQCGLKFKSFNLLVKHTLSTHNKPSNFLCYQCGSSFNYEVELHDHIMNEHRADGVQCRKCGLVLSTNNKYLAHLRLKHYKKRTKCNICNTVFPSAYLRRQHEKREHLDQTATCSACDKVFSSKYSLHEHYSRVHLKEKRFKCEYCSARFLQKFTLNNHIKGMHMGVRDIECSVCGAIYRNGSSLYRHKKKFHPELIKSRPAPLVGTVEHEIEVESDVISLEN